MPISVPQDYVYLDWAATAPLCAEAYEAMLPYLALDDAGLAFNMNANSLHAPGRAAFEALELARREVARAVGASRPNEVVFTSGATESDNAAVFGLARAARKARAGRGGFKGKPRVISTKIEHEAVMEPVKRLSAEGFETVLLDPDRNGFVGLEALEAALNDDTVLVTVQMANSEVGAIQPVAELCAASHARNALFHTDATQALGKVPFDARGLEVDAASFSAHKIGGPKGVGALYLKARTPFEPILLGGGQEEGRRSTTQNVCGIAGFAAACKAAVELLESEPARQRAIRDGLYARLTSISGVRPTVQVRGDSPEYLPNIVHVLVKGYESETLILRLDAKGFGVSGGSACSSHSLEPSRTLLAMGIPADDAFGSLRVSIGRDTKTEQIEAFVDALGDCIG